MSSAPTSSVPEYVQNAVEFIRGPIVAIATNETVTNTTQKVTKFISDNKVWLFCIALTVQVFTSPVISVLTCGVGFWAFDKEFIVNPGDKHFTTQSFLSTPI